MPVPSPAVDALFMGLNADPHGVLGVHRRGKGVVIRTAHPTARKIALVADGQIKPMRRVDPRGLFEVPLAAPPAAGHRFELHHVDGSRQSVGDPYRFLPSLGELDLHLIGEGRHERLWEVLGAHPVVLEGVAGVRFALWAPNAKAVRVVGDWNGWDGRIHPMRSLGSSGVWELFVPLLEVGSRYKFELVGADGRLVLKADPLARAAELPPATASIVERAEHEWTDDAWMAARPGLAFDRQLSFYEVHLPSWRTVPEHGGRPLSYLELADALADHVEALGFTHIELLPVAEHPFGGSWGYQVSGYYAPSSRHGTPDDFRAFVDTLHQRGIGVVVDWVPAHFPRDDFSLAHFDGTALYEHADPRQGEHPDWGTLIFNYGRNEVRNFLIANALYWLESFHLDGLRVDAVASMLYLDYSRESGEWLPNSQGGRENLEAVAFLQELNTVVHRHHPGTLTIAEESTAWGGVSHPVDGGGLGFTHKWNMGWMHDTLRYFGNDPIYRSHHHNELTFGLVYAWTENFISPLSHDEVVHGKGSLLDRMPGDGWQRFANLRALFAWMWAHPGKQLLFMGGEFGQGGEWNHERSLDWHLLDDVRHGGIARLVGDLNRIQASFPALYSGDFDPAGFRWLDAVDAAASVFVFLRLPGAGSAVASGAVVCAANLTPVPRPGYRIGLPRAGRWREVLNTDAAIYGGSGLVNGDVVAEGVPWQGCEFSAVITMSPLAVLWFAQI